MSSAASIIYLGMDVHKGSITIAVLPMGAKSPTHVDRIPNDFAKLKRYLERLARQGELRSCYEASGAGYVLHRALRDWGYACDVIAPSLIPHRPGVQRKHDKRDACDLARRYRAGELTSIRILPRRRNACAMWFAAGRPSNGRFSNRVTTFSSSSPAVDSSIARGRTGARPIWAGSST